MKFAGALTGNVKSLPGVELNCCSAETRRLSSTMTQSLTTPVGVNRTKKISHVPYPASAPASADGRQNHDASISPVGTLPTAPEEAWFVDMGIDGRKIFRYSIFRGCTGLEKRKATAECNCGVWLPIPARPLTSQNARDEKRSRIAAGTLQALFYQEAFVASARS